MPEPSQIHIDVALTNMSQAVKNTSLVADQIFPVVNVVKDSDKYFKYGKENLRIDKTLWAPKTKAKEVDWTVSTDSYSTERHALQELVEDDEKVNADAPISVEADTVEILTEKMLLRREKTLATMLTTTGNYDADARPSLAANARWNAFDSAQSDPNTDLLTARKTVYAKTFQRPNTLILPYQVYEVVREHPKVLERIKYVTEAVVTEQVLARLWGLQKVIVAGAGENSAPEGAADSLAYIWGKFAFLGYIEPSPRLKKPSWGYHIQSQRLMVDRWRDEERKGDVIRVSFKEVPKIVTTGAGYLIQTVID